MRKVSSRYIISQLSIVFALIVILQSAGPWFLWGNALISKVAVISFLCCRLLLLERIPLRVSYILICLYLFYIWMGIFQAEENSQPITLLVGRYLPLLFIILMEYEEKIRLKDIIINVFSIVIAVSLFAYIIWLCGFSLPSVKMWHPLNTWYPPFLNYYYFITELNVGEFLRFRSVFTEPGHLGMYCALFLYINGYTLKKWQNVVLLIALILSLSLAAYILLLLGWILYQVMSGTSIRRVLRLLFVMLLLGCVGWFYVSKTSNDNVLSVLILDRLSYDSEKGLKGNNRNTYEFTRTYKQLTASEYFIGKGNTFMRERFANTANSSYRNFILTNGLIGFLLLLAFFFSVVHVFPSRLALGLFFLYVASFIQRPYWLLEVESWMYLCAVPVFYKYRRVYNQ